MIKVKSYLTQLFKNHGLKTVLFYAALMVVVFAMGVTKIIAPDCFKALYTGRYISLFMDIPHHSEFTFSPVKDFFPGEAFNWLVNLTIYGLHQLGGFLLLQGVRVFLIVFMVVITHSLIGYRCTPLALLVLVGMVLGSHQKYLLRNAIFLIPFVTLLMWLWYRSRVEEKWIWAAGFPVLFLFWGNMHGTYLVGIGLLGLMVLGDMIDSIYISDHPGLSYSSSYILLLILLVFIVIFVKPFPDFTAVKVADRIVGTGGGQVVSSLWYGETGLDKADEATTNKSLDQDSADDTTDLTWREQLLSSTRYFLQNTVFDTDRPSASGKDFPLTQPFMFMTVSLLIVIVTMGAFAASARYFRLSEFLPVIAASVIGMGYVRTVALIPLVCVPVLFIKYSRGDYKHVKLGNSVQWISSLVVIIFLGSIGYHVYYNNFNQVTNTHKSIGFGKAARWSDAMPEFILENYREEQIYNRYVLGTYLIWKWWPEKKVLIDGKSLAYKAEFLKELAGTSFHNYADEHDIDYLLLPTGRSGPYFQYIPDPRWEVIGFDRGFILFHRVHDKRPQNVTYKEARIYSEEEFDNLSPGKKVYVKNLGNFVKRYQNDQKYMGIFTNPFQRFNEDINASVLEQVD